MGRDVEGGWGPGGAQLVGHNPYGGGAGEVQRTDLRLQGPLVALDLHF